MPNKVNRKIVFVKKNVQKSTKFLPPPLKATEYFNAKNARARPRGKKSKKPLTAKGLPLKDFQS
jgi:hypothetical protein